MPEAARTLVKSPPELWAELSDPSSLTRHLGAFGEIRITRLVPESTVAWEGERASGTVDLEPAGWGTRVTVRADETMALEAPPRAEPEAPTVELPATPEAPARLLARLFRRRPRTAQEAAPAERRAAPAPAPVAEEGPEASVVLDAMLDTLGSARHRPFSRG